MFITERTDIHPCFGITLQQALHHVSVWTRNEHMIHGNDSSQAPVAEDILNLNPHAIKVLQQHPEWVNASELARNTSHEAIDLQKTLRYPLYHYQRALCYHPMTILDTYLQDPRLKFTGDDLFFLSSNARAVPYLQRHPDLIRWIPLSKNPEALDLLEANPEKIEFMYLSSNSNPRAVALLRNNLERVDWNFLSMNPCNEALDLLLEHPDKIKYGWLTYNTNPRAIDLLRSQPVEQIHWSGLSGNPCNNALEILAENKTHIDWTLFCLHASTKEQFVFLRANLDRVDWRFLCKNPSDHAVELLKEHPHRIQWWSSLQFQNVFETITEYDYAGIRATRQTLHEEFHAWAGHPCKILTKWKDWGFDTPGMDMEEEGEGEDVVMETAI